MIHDAQIMKDLDILYARINSEGKNAIQNGEESIDPYLLHMEQDKRRGLVLLVNVHGQIAGNLSKVEKEIKAIEPQQYYYPDTDLHVTIIDLISASIEFTRDEAVINKSIKIIENAIIGIKPFEIQFKGIIVSNGAILVKGYYSEELPQLRGKLRKIAIERDFDLKERYQSISAHTTIGRFMTKISNNGQFLERIREYHDFEIGTIRVNELELVIHDWYNSQKEEIKKFILRG